MEQSNQSKDKDRKNLFSQYIELQDLLMQPLKPLIHLVGFQPIHPTIMTLTIDSAHAKDSKNFKSYAVQSYDFFDSSNPSQPLIYTQTSKGDKIRTQDLGFLKYSFFRSLTTFKPAVTIIVFDWQNQTDSNYEWKTYEAQVLAEVKQHQDKCPGSRQSKIVLLIFLPLNDTGSVDEKITSLKRAVASRGDDNIKTFFLLTSGFDGLKNISKKFVKNLNDLAFTYYREKKFYIKKKQKKLIKEQIENIRYSFKHGIYSSYTKGDYQTPVKYMKEAYNQLRLSIGNSGARTSFEEKRENADLITIKILQLLISNGNHQLFLEQYRQHIYTFQTKVSLLRKEQRFEEIKWRANWMRIMSQFLEMFPPPTNEASPDLFQGFYTLNAMELQIARKQEFKRLVREKGDHYYDEKEMSSLNPRMHNLIGKDFLLQDVRDPLGGSNKFTNEQKQVLEKFKVYSESLCDLEPIILEYAQRSIQLYKNRSRGLKGNSSAMYRRLVHFISYHISEFVLASVDNAAHQTQKYRGQIARSLISEGWIQEALTFVEKAKSSVSQNIEDFFSYEMEILNYDKMIRVEERHQRFQAMIHRVQNQELEVDDEGKNKHHNLVGFLVGPQLIWSRARFDLKNLQVNKYNKLNVELYTKLEECVAISKIILRFNDPSLNIELTDDFKLSKDTPLVIDKELYISKEGTGQREFIQLNEIFLEIKKIDDDKPHHDLGFLIKPYLKPQDDLLEMQEGRRKPSRIKDPIIFNIEAMPSKVKFRFELDENREQALLGDFYNVFIYLETEDITITDLALKVDGIESETTSQTEAQQMEMQNLMVSQMDDTKSTVNVSMMSSQIMNRSMTIQRQNSGGLLQKQNSFTNDILPTLGQSNSAGLPNFSKPKSQIFKEVEFFYEIEPTSNIDDSDNGKLQELDYTQDDSQLELPKDCRKLRLALKFYNEAQNSVNLQFIYSFTQNSDKEDQKQTMKQTFKKALKVKSQSPFKIEWQVKNADPFIQNLKLRNEQLQLATLLAPNHDESFINCTFISQSLSKIIYLSNVNMDIVERQKVSKLSYLDYQDQEAVRLTPGEGYECIFKVKTQLDTSESGNKLVSEVDQFADLQFSWNSQHTTNEVVLDSSQNLIHCTLPSPPLTVVEIPLKLTILNEKQLQKAILYQPIGVDIEVYNESENPIDAELIVDESDDFYIGGELKSYVHFMPYDRYIFKFNIIPLQIGRLSLPKLNIAEVIEPERTISLIKGFTKKCLIIK